MVCKNIKANSIVSHSYNLLQYNDSKLGVGQAQCIYFRVSNYKREEEILNWLVTGINYKKANVQERQDFALSESEIEDAYCRLAESGVKNALILSTCNRTEFFLPIDSATRQSNFLSSYIYKKDIDTQHFNIKENDDATRYFFNICSGMESQIPGDFEILGQVRKACKLAKKNNMLSGVWEKTVNSGLRAAKRSRNETKFFSGASSTSYATIEFLKSKGLNIIKQNILLIGAGKIGTHTIEHLLKLGAGENITITNRSADKAEELAQKYEISSIPFEKLGSKAGQYDVIICATNAPEYVVTADVVNLEKTQYLIDLSVPLNIDPAIKEIDNKILVDVDQLSKAVEKNLAKREGERSRIEAIIEEELEELSKWYAIRNGLPIFSDLKEELEQMKAEILSDIGKKPSDDPEFIDQYTDRLFDHLSQNWIKKVRNIAINA